LRTNKEYFVISFNYSVSVWDYWFSLTINNCNFVIPSDVIIAKNNKSKGELKTLDTIDDTDIILDIGQKTIENISLVLIDPEEIKPIRVGESGFPSLPYFNDIVDISDNEMLIEASATPKLGIEFKDFYKIIRT